MINGLMKKKIKNKEELSVLIIGPGKKTEGGITTVIQRVTEGFNSIDRVKWRWIASHRSGNIFFKLYQFLAGFIEASYHINDYKVMHIHSSAFISFWRKSIFFWLSKLFGVPVIWHLHTPDKDFLDFFSNQNIFGSYARFVLGKCFCVVVLSDRWRELVKDTIPSVRIKVIYNPIPFVSDKGNFSSVTKDKKILYLAHLIPRKGYADLIQAFASVIKGHPESRLVFAGSGETGKAINLCKNLGVLDNVDFLGWIKGSAITEEFKSASIFVLPSYQEGLPMGVLEAMAFHVPVVTTPVGGIPDVITNMENGILFEPGDIDSLSSALDRLLDNEKLCREIAENASTSVQNLSPESIAKEWSEIYSECTTINSVKMGN